MRRRRREARLGWERNGDRRRRGEDGQGDGTTFVLPRLAIAGRRMWGESGRVEDEGSSICGDEEVGGTRSGEGRVHC